MNGEAIYKSKPWHVCQNDTASDQSTSNIFYTTRKDSTTNETTLYALIRKWPEDDKLRLSCPEVTNRTTARMLGVSREVTWVATSVEDDHAVSRARELNEAKSRKQGMELDLPPLSPATIPCQHAWVVALTGLANV